MADIQDARAAGYDDYFIGLMVFMRKGPKEFTILDGQQRIATATILLASIRTWLRQRGFNVDAEQIQNSYIAVRELGEQELEPRLILNENNNQTFRDYVIGEAPSDNVRAVLGRLKKYDPNRHLLEATLFCREKVDEIADHERSNSEEAAKRLFDLVRYVRDNVKIVRLSVPNEANAYTVFETLNDRGLDLSVLDLVKNYLFGKAGAEPQLQQIQSRWAQMMATLANVQADEFLKAYWTSRYGRIQKAQLFPDFRVKADSWRSVSQISADMLTTSEQYAALDIADDPVWEGLSDRSRQRIRDLNLLGSRQVHPILLSALAKFSLRELERLLHLLEVLIVRYQLILGGRTGRLEISCASLAAAIYQGRIKTATEAFQALKDIFPSDAEFQEAFRWKQERNNRKAHYILEGLENQGRQAQAKQMSAELGPIKSLTVEHILPRGSSSAWEPILQQDPSLAEDCTYRLGNMCLLSGINRELGGKSFADKRKVFEQSALILTKAVASHTEWNRRSIEQAQAKMAKLAVAAWRFQ